MKFKGSIKNLKIDTAFIIAAVGGIIALGIRLFQTFSGLIDFETGFYTQESITTYILYAVMVLTAFGIFLVCTMSGEIPQEKMPTKKSPVTAVLVGAFAVTLLVTAISEISSFGNIYLTFNPPESRFIVPESERYSINFFISSMPYLMKIGALPKLLAGVFAVLSSAFFGVLALGFAGIRKADLTKIKFMSLCPLFWATFRMVERFTRTISFINVSSLFLEMFMIAFMMMFFMYFAQMSSQVNAKAISFKIFGYGLIATVISAVVVIPKLLLFVVNSSYRDLANEGLLECPIEIADLGFCLFAVSFLVLCLTVPRIKNMTLKETEKLIRQEEE